MDSVWKTALHYAAEAGGIQLCKEILHSMVLINVMLDTGDNWLPIYLQRYILTGEVAIHFQLAKV